MPAAPQCIVAGTTNDPWRTGVMVSLIGARLARHVPDAIAHRVFGAVLVVFSLVFLALRLG